MRPQSWKKSETQGPWFWFCFSNVDSILCRYLLETPLIFWPRNKESLLQSNLREIGKGKINVSKNLWFFPCIKKGKVAKIQIILSKSEDLSTVNKGQEALGGNKESEKGKTGERVKTFSAKSCCWGRWELKPTWKHMENASALFHLKVEGAGVCIHLPYPHGLRAVLGGAHSRPGGLPCVQAELLSPMSQRTAEADMAMGSQQKYKEWKVPGEARVTAAFTQEK